MTWTDVGRTAPELVLVLASVAVLLVDAWRTGPHLEAERRGMWGPGLALAAVVLASLAAWRPPGGAGMAFFGMYARDGLTRVLDAAALGARPSRSSSRPRTWRGSGSLRGEYYALLLLATSGAMLMGASRNLVLLFLGLELMSFPLYVLAAWPGGAPGPRRPASSTCSWAPSPRPSSSTGSRWSTGPPGPRTSRPLAAPPPPRSWTRGLGLLVIGLGFEAALVPFHAWAPDVYEGAPLPVTAFMSVAAKVGAFGGFLRVFPLALPHLVPVWGEVLAALAVATMIRGKPRGPSSRPTPSA